MTLKNRKKALVKLVVCGLCGSKLAARERLVKNTKGKIRNRTYYECAKILDSHCTGSFIPEKDLFKQFAKIIRQIGVDDPVQLKDWLRRNRKRIVLEKRKVRHLSGEL